MNIILHFIFIGLFVGGLIYGAKAEEDLIVFSASSLGPAIEEISTNYTKEFGAEIIISQASSSTLARQIENGAPAHIFLSANKQWVDYLTDKKSLSPNSQIIGTNTLQLVGNIDENLIKGDGIEGYLNSIMVGRIAIGEPSSVPLGIYTKEALTNMGVWGQVLEKYAPTRNARSALKFVELGTTKIGIIYKSDAWTSAKITILFDIPREAHNPIQYIAALTNNTHSKAQTFIAYLLSSKGRKILKSHGFGEAP